ncbi:MAG: 3'(2'),5'-bisphosphate nucleotidase CysQ [Rhizobiaceae bacterium]
MTPDQLYLLVEELTPVARKAGDAILDVYAHDVTIESKQDGSPVTIADRRAEAIILAGLRGIAPDIAVVSEENAASHSLTPPDLFFLVDPLDGTREFVKRDGKGSFTVNIALIKNGSPILGIVFAPALNRMFTGIAFEATKTARENDHQIFVRNIPEDGPVAVASASHRDDETDAWLNKNGIERTVSIGSSLKFCLLAAGEADSYPRFGPTMEWDTAAGDAVLRAAGGTVEHKDGEPLTYGKPDYRNGAFIARGRFSQNT